MHDESGGSQETNDTGGSGDSIVTKKPVLTDFFEQDILEKSLGEILKLLQDRKAEIEKSIDENGEILKANNVGLTESLIDGEGFPRGDVDLYQVREARHKINCLQNDHKNLMTLLEEYLHKFHSQNKSSSSDAVFCNSNGPAANIPHPEIFLAVERVDLGSPADQAGLLVNDKIFEFGSIVCDNFEDSIENVATVVRHSIGKSIHVGLIRKTGNVEQVMHLSLMPHNWNGPGVLGCLVVPIKK